MHRREFLASSLAVTSSLCLGDEPKTNPVWNKELARHRIAKVETGSVRMQWPRLVGKNARLGVHGRGPRVTVCRLTTDREASGWGNVRGGAKQAKDLLTRYKDKNLGELFAPSQGVLSETLLPWDFALHDLAGQILGVPVYKMLGDVGTKATPCYSGMIYMDDLDPPEEPAGIEKVLANCTADIKRGYRQLKVKIGRGNKWMPKEQGLQRDIDVTKAIAKAFPEITILVDGNNGFTAAEFLDYLDGIGDIPLFWIEEPFHETVVDYEFLTAWLIRNKRKTLLADGEAKPDWKVLDRLFADKVLDVQLVDIVGYGFTPWRKLLAKLKKQKVLASPHAWGHALKTNYISHLAAGLGNVVTIEGVTCASDDVDFGAYRLEEGKLTVSEAPGFGMRWKNENRE